MKRIAVVGATSSMAQHCLRLWLKREAADVTLIGRDAARLERVAADLRVRSPQSRLHIKLAEFLDSDAIAAVADDTVAQGQVDVVLIAHGSLPSQGDCLDDLNACREALEVNGISPVLYAEAFCRHLAATGHGTLALIGSVAGDRGRKSNYVYGASKGLVTRYAEGLQHRFAGTGVKVVLIKPGPTDTPMTAHLAREGNKLASVKHVASIIVDAIDRGAPVTYAPGRWRIIMLVIRHLPRFVFHRLNI